MTSRSACPGLQPGVSSSRESLTEWRVCDSGGWGDWPVSPACRWPAVWLSGRFLRIPPEAPSLGFLLLFKGFCGLSISSLGGFEGRLFSL